MITEEIIDQSIDRIQQMDFDEAFGQFSKKHPLLVSYLAGEQFAVLEDTEYQILLFEAMIIAECFNDIDLGKDETTAELLEECESANWAAFDSEENGSFHDRLDIFFDHTDEEDLLAFIEDSLVDDEESEPIHPASREIIFITLKSIVDFFGQVK